MDGYQGFMALRDLLRTYYQVARANATTKTGDRQPLALNLHVWEEDEHWQVVPTGPDALSRSRSGDQPLLFNYALSLTALRRITDEAELKDDLFGPKDPFGASKGIDDALGKLGEWVAGFGDLKIGNTTLGQLGQDLIATGKNVLEGVDAVAGGFNSATAAVKNLTAKVRGLQKQVRAVMQRVTKAVAAAGRAAGALYGFVNTVREVGCMARNLYGWLTSGLVDTFNSGWSAARRRKVGC
jgi:hypothetical protein